MFLLKKTSDISIFPLRTQFAGSPGVIPLILYLLPQNPILGGVNASGAELLAE
jgi:hypothetical protein